MLLVIGPLCGLGLVDAFEVGLVGVTSLFIIDEKNARYLRIIPS